MQHNNYRPVFVGLQQISSAYCCIRRVQRYKVTLKLVKQAVTIKDRQSTSNHILAALWCHSVNWLYRFLIDACRFAVYYMHIDVGRSPFKGCMYGSETLLRDVQIKLPQLRRIIESRSRDADGTGYWYEGTRRVTDVRLNLIRECPHKSSLLRAH